MAATKERAATPAEAAAAALAAGEADLRAAEGEMAQQEVAERRLLAEHPAWRQNPSQHPELVAVRVAYNDAYRAAEAARGRVGAAKRAARAARADASRLPLPAARAALAQAEADHAALVGEQAALGRAQRSAAERGEAKDVTEILARRDQLPHKLTAAQMAVLAAQEQVYLGEADEADEALPALRRAVEETLPALEAAKAAHANAQAEVHNAHDAASTARRRARATANARRQLVEDMSRDRGPVVRSMPHAGAF